MSALTQICFSQRHVFTCKLSAFTHTCLHAQVLLHRDACTAGAFTHRRAGISTHRCLYTAMRLHRNAVTHQYMCFYTGILLTQSSLYTQKLLHKYSYAEMVPTQKYSYIKRFLYTDNFTKRRFFHSFFKQRDAFTHGCF